MRFSVRRKKGFTEAKKNMSLCYAEKLSYIEDVGNVGMAEYFESSHKLQEKVRTFEFIRVLCLDLFPFICLNCAFSFWVLTSMFVLVLIFNAHVMQLAFWIEFVQNFCGLMKFCKLLIWILL